MALCYSQMARFTPGKYLDAALGMTESAYRGTIFPEGDHTLEALDAKAERIPKLYPTKDGFKTVTHSFVSGPSAALHRGTDIVYYYERERPKGITGAVRFGLKAASIVLPEYEYATAAHGGAVEAVLDDLTGTVVRHCQSVWMATSEFTAKLKKPCPIDKTMTFEGWVDSVEKRGLYCIAKAKILCGGVVIATAEAKMVDTVVLAQLMKR
mmetsp:Transcript_6323/g.18772  ORF Transcript_6323/g.18772 Transcript_6323/m.18772 type:complete len:210 (+) Transcript_6323:199-828(+)